MKTLAPQLSALMTILRSVGPVISTRRSCISAGTGATRQDGSSRMAAVSGKKSGSAPLSMAACLASRASSRSLRRAVNFRAKLGEEFDRFGR